MNMTHKHQRKKVSRKSHAPTRGFRSSLCTAPIQERRSVVEGSLLDADAGGHRVTISLWSDSDEQSPSGSSECAPREALAR